MNKPLVTSLILFTVALSGSTSLASDILDAPGPGYRQQIERLFPTTNKDISVPLKVGAPIIHVVPTSFPTPTLPLPHFATPTLLEPSAASPSERNPFSAPIRRSNGNSVTAPTRGHAQKPK
ncbi:MAG TPA: hypothetical protein VF614_16265 [Chthoniobacteraceae bacterium]